jgi:hypothetical protein
MQNPATPDNPTPPWAWDEATWRGRVDQVRAARHVDHITAGLQARQRLAVEDVLGVRRQGKQVDQVIQAAPGTFHLLEIGVMNNFIDFLR